MQVHPYLRGVFPRSPSPPPLLCAQADSQWRETAFFRALWRGHGWNRSLWKSGKRPSACGTASLMMAFGVCRTVRYGPLWPLQKRRTTLRTLGLIDCTGSIPSAGALLVPQNVKPRAISSNPDSSSSLMASVCRGKASTADTYLPSKPPLGSLVCLQVLTSGPNGADQETRSCRACRSSSVSRGRGVEALAVLARPSPTLLLHGDQAGQ